MFKQLKQLFSEQETSLTNGEQYPHLAAVALLLEVSHADHSVDTPEIKAILDIAKNTLNISESDIDGFFSSAELSQKNATSLYEFTDIINRNWNKASKFSLICSLWEVAYADGTIDRYEDHTIRKIAELIYVSHSEFIRAKHLVDPSRLNGN